VPDILLSRRSGCLSRRSCFLSRCSSGCHGFPSRRSGRLRFLSRRSYFSPWRSGFSLAVFSRGVPVSPLSRSLHPRPSRPCLRAVKSRLGFLSRRSYFLSWRSGFSLAAFPVFSRLVAVRFSRCGSVLSHSVRGPLVPANGRLKVTEVFSGGGPGYSRGVRFRLSLVHSIRGPLVPAYGRLKVDWDFSRGGPIFSPGVPVFSRLVAVRFSLTPFAALSSLPMGGEVFSGGSPGYSRGVPVSALSFTPSAALSPLPTGG